VGARLAPGFRADAAFPDAAPGHFCLASAYAEAAAKPCIDRLDVIIFLAAPRANELRSFEILE
jgi:hypothetical protein